MAAEDFRKINISFKCGNCGYIVPPAQKTSRNHCPKCFYSKHVDIVPGDRKEICQGLMAPINYEYKAGEYRIVHKCVKCGKISRNKTANDDGISELLTLIEGVK